MALATYATRVAGLFLVRGVAVKGRLKAALDALPPAILMAVIAPTILLTGNAERIAAVLATVSAFFRLPLTVTIIVGVVSVVVLRQFIA
jgi:branched chain amino acid efflux pump